LKKYMHWIIATIFIFLIVIAAYREYISSMVSQILLVLTVIVFSVVQRKYKL
jgi:cytochrome b561